VFEVEKRLYLSGQTQEWKLESNVNFGGKCKRDGLGLKGKGKVKIDGDSIILEGRQHTAPFFKILLWLITAMMMTNICFVAYSMLCPGTGVNLMWVVIVCAIGFILVIAVATILTGYFGSSPYSTRFSKRTVTGLKIDGNIIRFRPSAEKDICVFRTATEQEALEIQRNLNERSE
jgi:hypothetical protein